MDKTTQPVSFQPTSRADDAAVLTITFSGGLADRNRLPLAQVIRTLQEFEELVKELGKRVQHDAGSADPDGDFGLEIIAGPTGVAFRKGSVKATAVATRDITNATKTFELILGQVDGYTRKRPRQNDMETSIVARRMYTMAKLQAPAKSLVAFALSSPNRRVQKVSLDDRAYVHLLGARRRLMRVEGLQLYGRLIQLNDRSRKADSDGHFWGRLLTEKEEFWRLRFDADKISKTLPLFMKQVVITGDATYFGPAQSPKLSVSNVALDPQRDYLKAFDTLRTSGTKLFGDATTEDLLVELYG